MTRFRHLQQLPGLFIDRYAGTAGLFARAILLIVFAIDGFADAADSNLVDLAEQQQWERVTASLDRGADPNQVQADGMTALHWAAVRNQPFVVKQLVDHGASVDTMTRYRVTPLSLACEYGNAKAASILMEAEADVSVRRLGKETPLMLAARNGNATIVRQLIAAGAAVDAKEVGGQTALMWAAAAGNTSVVESLIEAGSDIMTELSSSGFTAPLFAARQGRLGVMKIFVEAGYVVGTAIRTKRKGGRDPRSGMSALMLAIESGHLELALWLVEQGADPNDQRSGFAPLHAITWVRKTELGDNPAGDPAPRITGSVHTLGFVRAIIAAGADVNLRLENGKSKGGV